MAKSLIIVESPAKTKTLKGFLGKDFQVEASMGHVRDLPKSKIGVDVRNDFEQTYVPLTDRKDVLSKLAAAAKGADTIYLASDPDREGEAIAWHLAEALKLKGDKIRRIQFNEITKTAVQEALRHPRQIDMNRVDAQKARRALDRFVGYMISPLLWKKVKPDLSAGRVQSPAVRLICDRENEIKAFVPVEYWSITARVTPQTRKPFPFDADLNQFEGKKFGMKNQEEADKVLSDLDGAFYRVAKVKKSERQRRPTAPFITSTLQQEAARKLGFSSKRTMTTAQQLYEGIDLGSDGGTVGLITYMRTDSTRIAAEAQAEAKQYIQNQFGPEYAPERFNVYKTKGEAQDAHEAIRPTSVFREPDSIRGHLKPDQYKLYRLVWLRFVASQMKPAILDVVTADIAASRDLPRDPAVVPTLTTPGVYGFRAAGSTVRFDGFLRVYTEGKDDNKVEDEERPPLPPLLDGQVLDLISITPKQHFTEPPPRFSEATLVKALEEKGIGRPSTYASIISTIQDRGYVELKEKKFYPTDLGFVVTELLVKHFPDILDTAFTARMEDKLDQVEEGQQEYRGLMQEFYPPFEQTVKQAEEGMEKVARETDIDCPNCGRKLIERFGRFGKFYGCPGYPECKYILDPSKANGTGEGGEGGEGTTAPAPVVSEITCPNCGRNLVEKMGRFGKFLACPGYPECKYIHKEAPKSIGIACPECGKGELVERRSRMGVFYPCNRYPECKFSLPGKPITDRPCPQCGGLLHERAYRGRVTGIKCANKECSYSEGVNGAAAGADEGEEEGAKPAATAAAPTRSRRKAA